MPSPTQRQGARHEHVAEEELTRRGYLITERNVRTRRGEIDRIAEDGDVLVFVEIRSRSSLLHGRPSESVGAKKQRSVVRAAASARLDELHDAGAWPRENGFERVATVAAVDRLCAELRARAASFVFPAD